MGPNEHPPELGRIQIRVCRVAWSGICRSLPINFELYCSNFAILFTVTIQSMWIQISEHFWYICSISFQKLVWFSSEFTVLQNENMNCSYNINQITAVQIKSKTQNNINHILKNWMVIIKILYFSSLNWDPCIRSVNENKCELGVSGDT